MRKFKDFVIYQVATGFSTGLSPYAPGTVGSLVGVILLWLIWPNTYPLLQLLMTLAVVVVAVYTSHWFAEAESSPDPAPVVIDEIAGVFVTFLWLPVPVGFWVLVLGFILFRIFDIWKPWPIRRAERLPGGLGITMDDVIAGVMANILMQIVLRVI